MHCRLWGFFFVCPKEEFFMKRSTKIMLSAVAVVAALVCIVCCLLIYQYVRGGMLNSETCNLFKKEVQ